MSFYWKPEDYEQLSPWVKGVRQLLQAWFEAMEAGTHVHRHPDPAYDPQISPETSDRIVEHIEERFAYELRQWAGVESSMAKAPEGQAFTHTPGFDRLEAPQRMALAQELHMLKRRLREEDE